MRPGGGVGERPAKDGPCRKMTAAAALFLLVPIAAESLSLVLAKTVPPEILTLPQPTKSPAPMPAALRLVAVT